MDDTRCILVKHICVSVPRCIPTLLHGPGCNMGNGRGAPSCALLGGFAIGACFVAITTYPEREMSASAISHQIPMSKFCTVAQRVKHPTYSQEVMV